MKTLRNFSLFLVAVLSGAAFGFGQTTAVTATLTDTDSQTWNNGSWSAQLFNPSQTEVPVYCNTGVRVPQSVSTTALSNIGILTGNIPDNTQVCPANTRWVFTLCPNAGQSLNNPSCTVTPNVLVTGATQNLSSLLSGYLQAPRFNGIPGAYGYLDVEVNAPIQGSEYYNVISDNKRCYAISLTWQNCASANGSVSGQLSGIVPLATAPTVIGAQSHLDDGITTANTITSKEPFNAPIINTVLDLKSKFGASGSQQTMTCNLTGGVASLTACSGSDFKTGQWVYIQSAGGNPTISAPSAPTLTCHFDNGGVCAGAVVYGYQIVAIQATPNGALTAASTATTVTQGAQSPRAPIGSGRPDVYTTVAWTTVTNANGYLIYKSINGGAYNFYTIFPGSSTNTFNDYGHWSASVFTCVDIGVPCTAPASAVPNDVFATITANGPGSWTLSALPFPPKYSNNVTLNGSGTYPFTPSQTGTFTIQHDDTPSFQSAWNYMTSNGGSNFNLHIPSGNFNLHAENPFGRAGSAMNLQGLNNFLLDGNGESSKLFMSNDRAQNGTQFLDGVCGYGSLNPPGSCQTMGSTNGGGTTYALTDPASMGTYSVTLVTPANASNFPAGTYVTIGTNAAGYPQQDYAEMNLVASSSTITGVINLVYPISKPYSATLPVPYNNCTACQGAPQIGPVLPVPVATHVKLRNFWFRGAVTFINFNTIDDLKMENLDVMASFGEVQGFTRHRLIQNNRLQIDGYGYGAGFFGEAAASSGDYTVIGNTFDGPSNEYDQACDEGCTNSKWTGNRFIYHGIADTSNAPAQILNTGAESYNYVFTGNDIQISNGNLRGIIGANDNHAVANTIANNNFMIDSASGATQGSTVLCLTSQASSMTQSGQVYNNTWAIGNGGICGAKTSMNASRLQTIDEPILTGTSGALEVYDQYAGFSVLDIGPLTGNVSSFNLGSQRTAGLTFQLAFIQASAGGPFNLPADCLDTHWTANGSGIDCSIGVPIINPAASSKTYLQFYDDGTTVHFLGESYSIITPTTVNNKPFLYVVAGTLQTTPHAVWYQTNLSGGTITVTLTGSAAFSNGSSYRCSANDNTTNAAVAISYTGGSTFLLTGTANDGISGVCIGN